jgi:uncharacterized protein YjiS (DUF1127 family)
VIRVLQALRRAWALRATRRELYCLSDHMLRDIGLRREEISSAFLQRVVLAEPRLAETRAGGLVAVPDGRREVPAA